jgi:hypothetical protein
MDSIDNQEAGRQGNLLRYPQTDTGNAERLVALYGHSIRFCPDWKKWLVWDCTRWKPDTTGGHRPDIKANGYWPTHWGSYPDKLPAPEQVAACLVRAERFGQRSGGKQ